MLTSLKFLNRGSQWPPESERERLKTYRDNRLVFEDEHARVYDEQLRRIERVVGNILHAVSFATILSYQKLITLKTADLIFGEPPKITAGKEAQQKVIDRVLTETKRAAGAYCPGGPQYIQTGLRHSPSQGRGAACQMY